MTDDKRQAVPQDVKDILQEVREAVGSTGTKARAEKEG